MKKISLLISLIIIVSLIVSCNAGPAVNDDPNPHDLNEDKVIVDKPIAEKEEDKLEEPEIPDSEDKNTLEEDKPKEPINSNSNLPTIKEIEKAKPKEPVNPNSNLPNLKKIEKKGYVTTNELNVRNLGSMQGKIISVVDKGVELHVFGEKNNWYYVEYAKNKKGWVYSKYVQFNPVTVPSIDTGSLSNKSYSWYFIRNNKHQQPGFDNSYKALLDKYDGITIGNKNKKDIFLTFDNGYENGYTVQILDILKRQNVKAGFFVQGSYIDQNPKIIKRMVNEGHLVLNHSNSHPQLPTLSKEKLKYEINVVAEKYKKVTGKEMLKFFRPPSGVFSERTLAETKALGYRTVFWSMAYRDWVVNDQPGKAASYKHVTDNIHNGAVILLHSVSKSNTEALEDIIIELKNQGYNFKLLSQYP